MKFISDVYTHFKDEKKSDFPFHDSTKLVDTIHHHFEYQNSVVLIGNEGFGKTRLIIEYIERCYSGKALIVDFARLNTSLKVDNFIVSCLVNEDIELDTFKGTKYLKNTHGIKIWDSLLSYIDLQVNQVQNINFTQLNCRILGELLRKEDTLLVLENAHEFSQTYIKEFIESVGVKTLVTYKKEKLNKLQIQSIQKENSCVSIDKRDVGENIKSVIQEMSFDKQTNDLLMKFEYNTFYDFCRFIDALFIGEFLKQDGNKVVYQYSAQKGFPSSLYECLYIILSDILKDPETKAILQTISIYNEKYFPKFLIDNDEILNKLCEKSILKEGSGDQYTFDHEMVMKYIIDQFTPKSINNYREKIIKALAENDRSIYYAKIANIFASIKEWEYAIAFMREYSKSIRGAEDKIKILEETIRWIHTWQEEDSTHAQNYELEVLEELAKLKKVVGGDKGCEIEVSSLFQTALLRNSEEYAIIARCIGAWHNGFNGSDNLDTAYSYFRKKRVRTDKLKSYRSLCLYDLCTREKAWNSDFKKARKYVSKIRFRFRRNSKESLSLYWRGLGSVYLEQMKIKKAYKCWKKALSVIEENYSQLEYSTTLCDFAYIKALLDHKDSESILNLAIKKSEDYNFTRNIFRGKINLANYLFYNSGKKKDAIRIIKEALVEVNNYKGEEWLQCLANFSLLMIQPEGFSKKSIDELSTKSYRLLEAKSGDNRLKNMVKYFFINGLIDQSELKKLENRSIDEFLRKWESGITIEKIEKQNPYFKSSQYAMYY